MTLNSQAKNYKSLLKYVELHISLRLEFNVFSGSEKTKQNKSMQLNVIKLY